MILEESHRPTMDFLLWLAGVYRLFLLHEFSSEGAILARFYGIFLPLTNEQGSDCPM